MATESDFSGAAGQIHRPGGKGGAGDVSSVRAQRLSGSSGAGRTIHSFDVFDTAICRTWHSPDHLHWAVGARLKLGGLLDVEAESWRRARVAAEGEAREASARSEVTLDEIYERLAMRLGLSTDLANSAKGIEIEEELGAARPVAALRERYHRLRAEGARTCFISDMYLAASVISGMLHGAGFDVQPHDVFASSAYGMSKALGDLYPKVAGAFGAQCSELLHTGDHRIADYRNARKCGARAVLDRRAHASLREGLLFRAGGGGMAASAIAGAARSARLAYGPSCRPGILTAASSVVGPLFTGYVLWVLRRVMERGGRRIYFWARDGQILKKICDRLIAWLGAPIETRYLYASRLAYLLPSLTEGRDQVVRTALETLAGEAVGSALRSLRYDEGDVADICIASGCAEGARIRDLSGADLGRLIDVLEAPDRLDGLCARIEEARAATVAYLEQEGFFDHEEAFVVDVGWRGTQQARMEKFLGERVHVAGHYIALSDRVIPESSDAQSWEDGAWVRAEVMEAFARADHTTLKHFALDGNGKAVCEPPLTEDAELVAWGVRDQQAVVELFVDNLLSTLRPDMVSPDDLHDALKAAGRAACDDMILGPSHAEAESYGRIEVACDMRHERVRPIAPAVSNVQAVAFVLNKQARRTHTNWYHGSLAQSETKPVAQLTAAALKTLSRIRYGARLKDLLRDAMRR